MTPQEQERIQACVSEIAQILYNNTSVKKITTLEEIEKGSIPFLQRYIRLLVVMRAGDSATTNPDKLPFYKSGMLP